MRTLRQLCVALVVTLALTIPAFAGGIETPIAPPTQAQTTTATTNGDIQTGLTGQDETDGSSETTVVGSVANAAVNLISALSLP